MKSSLKRLCRILVFLVPGLLLTMPLRAVEPEPESEQAALALKILNAYHASQAPGAVKKLQVVYFTPSDREPEPDYRGRLEAILEDVRAFYRDGMVRNGFGPETFDLARAAEGKWDIHLVKGREPGENYQKPDADKVIDECRPVLKAAGISFEQDTVLIFCNLAEWDEKAGTFGHHSPYYGISYGGVRGQTSGLCFAVDTVIQNLDNLTTNQPVFKDDEYGTMSLGKFNTIFIGGIAHELGHAFSLPHCGERWDEKPLGTSLMGLGNHTYREERRGEGPGTFLAMASAMKLAGRPLFSHTDAGVTEAPKLETCEFQLSTNVSRPDLAGRPGAFRLDGMVKGTPPVYGVIAYFDSVKDGGYHAPAATAVPDATGHFAIEVSDLAPCFNGELSIQFCHANGAISERRTSFQVRPPAMDDLEWHARETLEPLAEAMGQGKSADARTAADEIEKGSGPEPAKVIARKLVATLKDDPKPLPAEAPPGVTRLALGDAQAQSAEVGWLVPAANRIPSNQEIKSPLLDSGKIYATGLYAHAPSRYVYELGGKWKTLRGEAGLHSAMQSVGSVIFVIKADGREVFRSAKIRHSAKAGYDVDVTGVKVLELIVEQAEKSNAGNWGLWLDPTLQR